MVYVEFDPTHRELVYFTSKASTVQLINRTHLLEGELYFCVVLDGEGAPDCVSIKL